MSFKDNYIVSFSPHMFSKDRTNRIMLDVVIALVPSLIAGVIIFGERALLITTICVLSCMFFEAAFQKIVKKNVTISDFSAVITGMLLAFNLPVGIPIWQAVTGSFVAIVLVKQLFGGLGKNFANPALTARIFMFLAFSTTMTTWAPIYDAVTNASPINAVSGATPLNLIRSGEFELLPSMRNMFIGKHGGCIGETSALALLIGGAYLLIRRVITWHIPVTYIATVAALTAILGQPVLYHLLAGGLLLGAIFMATDYVTSPQINKGRLIFGIGCGVFTVIIRLYSNYPEGVSFAILFMNVLVPYINKFTLKKALGGIKA